MLGISFNRKGIMEYVNKSELMGKLDDIDDDIGTIQTGLTTLGDTVGTLETVTNTIQTQVTNLMKDGGTLDQLFLQISGLYAGLDAKLDYIKLLLESQKVLLKPITGIIESVSSSSSMTNPLQIYAYTGTTSGIYVKDHWYYCPKLEQSGGNVTYHWQSGGTFEYENSVYKLHADLDKFMFVTNPATDFNPVIPLTDDFYKLKLYIGPSQNPTPGVDVKRKGHWYFFYGENLSGSSFQNFEVIEGGTFEFS